MKARKVIIKKDEEKNKLTVNAALEIWEEFKLSNFS